MFILVLGASASGKSEFAENLCVKLANNQKKLYIATMEPFGEDANFRIKRHHKLRASKGFDTFEKYRNLNEFDKKDYNSVLLECMSTLLANEYFVGDNFGKNYRENIVTGVDKILGSCQNLILVSNKIFSDGITYPKETEDYIKALGELNCHFARKADVVIEIVCGIPIYLKGRDLLDGYSI